MKSVFEFDDAKANRPENSLKLNTCNSSSSKSRLLDIQIVEMMFACAGVILPAAPSYKISVVSLLGISFQVFNLVFSIWGTAISNEDDQVNLVRDILYEALTLLIMVVPLVLLHFVSRNAKYSSLLLEAINTSEDLPTWYYALPLLPVAIIGIASFTFYASKSELNTQGIPGVISNVVGNYPTAVGIIVTFLYAQKFAKDLDLVDFQNSNECLQNHLLSYKNKTEKHIKLLNSMFFVPMFFLWFLYLMIQLFYFGGDVVKKDPIIYICIDVIWTIGAAIMLCVLFVPAAEFTERNRKRIYNTITVLSKDPSNSGYIVWLDRIPMGWTMLSVEISAMILVRLIYILLSGIFVIMSRFMTHYN